MTDAHIFSRPMKSYDPQMPYSPEEATIFSEIVLWVMCQIIDLINAIFAFKSDRVTAPTT